MQNKENVGNRLEFIREYTEVTGNRVTFEKR